MIDISRLTGISICARSEASSRRIKEQLSAVIENFEAEDMLLIADQVCRGEEGAGYLMNMPLYKKLPDFSEILKLNFNSIGLTDVDCPKIVIAVTEDIDDVLRGGVIRLLNANQHRNYRCRFHLFVVDGSSENLQWRHGDFSVCGVKLSELRNQVSGVFNGEYHREEATSGDQSLQLV